MKGHRLSLALIAILLVVAPVVSIHSSARPSQIPNQGTSQTILLPGQARLVGTVTVRSLPETGTASVGQGASQVMYSQGAQAFAQAKNATEQAGFVPPGEATKTIVSSSTTSPQVPSATVNLVLQGVPGGSPNPCGCTPPDPNNAVGPNHVFEMVNEAGIIYLKNGTVAKPTFPLSTFFGLSGSMSDPQIMYDLVSGRWFASIIDVSTDNVRVAVSVNNDPTGTFNLYAITTGGNVPDQPFIGTSNDKFVVSANDFNARRGNFVGVQYWVLNKAELVNGNSTIDFSTTTPDSTMVTLRPLRHLTSTSQFYLATDCIGSCVTDPMSTTSTIELITVTGVPPGTVSISTHTLPISTSVQPANAAQPGTGTVLITNDNRILGAVWESNTLWLAWADSCIPAGDTTNRSCVHLVQATTFANGTITKNQDFDYASKGEYLFYPSVSLYHGQLVVVYGKSSSTLFPSLFVIGRLPGDPINTLDTPATIKTGTADDLSTRYGDYFGAGTDPLQTDNSTFWVSGEYRASSANAAWSTAIARVGSLAPNLLISAKPSNITLFAGSMGNTTITIASYKFTGTVNFTATVIPTGLSCSLSPGSVLLGTSASSKLSCAGFSAGQYNVTVTGSSGALSRSVSLPATVRPSVSVGGITLPVDKVKILILYAVPGLLASSLSLLVVAMTNRRRSS